MNTRRFSRAAAAVTGALLCSLLTAAPAAAQTPLDQLSPGPFQTATWDWDWGTTQTTNPSSGQPLAVNHYGQLSYPTDGSGGPLPPVANGSFPLVVFGHGRFFSSQFWPTNHLQAAYLMERLASWGVVSTSVNLGVVGGLGNPAGIPARGDLFRSTAFRTLDLLNQAGTPPAGLAAAIDGSRIGFMGHSRGGEGAVAGAIQNLLAGSPLPILAIGTISPTDFESYQLPADLPYMSLYGSKDGDVNNGWPIRLHDRNESESKVFEYIFGANHFWFTESLVFSGEGNADISRALHHEIAMGYLAGFMSQKLGVSSDPATVFADGPEMLPVTTQATILPMYRDPVRNIVDDFETNTATNQTSRGLPAGFAGYQYLFEDSFNQNNFTLYHNTRGGAGGWTAPGALWFGTLPNVDPVATPFFSIQFAQRESSAFNTVGQAQDVTLGLVDGDGDLATVRLSDFGEIPFPVTHPGGGPFGPTFPIKTVLRTTRVPLSAFETANPSLNLNNLSFFGWRADFSGTGELEFDAVEFTR